MTRAEANQRGPKAALAGKAAARPQPILIHSNPLAVPLRGNRGRSRDDSSVLPASPFYLSTLENLSKVSRSHPETNSGANHVFGKVIRESGNQEGAQNV